ncbi:MAG TPA: sialidase family protein, partial [Verrucomicrobiae bacterium]
DHGHSWRPIATLRDNNRDLDNGELLTLPNGSLRLAYRSVRWQQSYRLCVSGSEDGGVTWQPLSQPEANEGAPGSLGHPDKGVYEPGFCRLADGTLALFYANEKHVTETPAYSQIIAERLSHDNGLTWGPEIWVAWDTNAPSERPGMPVATRLADGRFMAVFEVVGKNEAKVFCKISPDGQTWAPGLGLVVPAQIGGPYVVALTNHWLAVTSNSGNVSLSEDYGATWRTNDPPVWGQGQVGHYWWLSIYQTGPEEIAVIGSCPRLIGGTDIRIRFGTLPGLLPPSP